MKLDLVYQLFYFTSRVGSLSGVDGDHVRTRRSDLQGMFEGRSDAHVKAGQIFFK